MDVWGHSDQVSVKEAADAGGAPEPSPSPAERRLPGAPQQTGSAGAGAAPLARRPQGAVSRGPGSRGWDCPRPQNAGCQQRCSQQRLIAPCHTWASTVLSRPQAYSCVGTTGEGAAKGRFPQGSKGDPAQGRGPGGNERTQDREGCQGSDGPPTAGRGYRAGRGPRGVEVHLLDLLRDVGHGEAIQPGHPREDIGQDAPVQLEGDLPDYAPILLSAGEALNLCEERR